MATNLIQDGERITIVAPAAAVSGAGVRVNNIFGVYVANANSGANATIATRGVYSLRKLNGASSAFTQGANVHWDNTNANCTVSATSNLKIGVAVVAAGDDAVAVQVRLNGNF